MATIGRYWPVLDSLFDLALWLFILKPIPVMATGNNLLFQNFRGQIGRQLVIKQYGDKMVLAAYPKMRKVKATPLKALYENRFREAVSYAQEVMHDVALKAALEAMVPAGRKLFNFIISEYLKRVKAGLPGKLPLK